MRTPREHIEKIRREKFSIGEEKPNPLREDMYQAVKFLSAELYSKDVHFLMELIQNAEDNEYLEGVKPSLEFIITTRDITATEAPATLLVFNNEKGFAPKNIESICSVGRSTKKGNRQRGYIGEKGIGFKSVFLITAQPYIFSNGYQIRFSEEPCPVCDIGYIVPEWVEANPTIADIQQVFSPSKSLPMTIMVLPLKPDKVGPVKQQLSGIHPEILLFLSKIKRLSIREDNADPSLDTVSSISISSETDFITRKNIDAESYTLHLSAEENGDEREKECSYHMWRQKFPVVLENRMERSEVDCWVITLAFPHGQRLNRGMVSPGVYAFLPTEMVTNFPFIIQADFILASSRETIRLDSLWNQGILDCVPSAFVNAFISLVKTTESAPVSSLPSIFEFLPLNSSMYPKLNAVRELIKEKLVEENIIPCESDMEQKFFCKPNEVGRVMPSFWNILIKARKQGVNLHNLSSHGKYVLNVAFDKKQYDNILNFLGVEYMDVEWYSRCIPSSNLVLGVSEDTYVELLFFIADNWISCFRNTNIKNIPLLKYVGHNGYVSLWSINEATRRNGGRAFLSEYPNYVSWLIDWNQEFKCIGDWFFVPKSTQKALCLHPKKETIIEWLSDNVSISTIGIYKFAVHLINSINSDRWLVIALAHFLYHSLSEYYLSESEVHQLCKLDKMPLVDNYGCVTTLKSAVLVPANGSKWVRLIGSNPWRRENYVELGEDYLYASRFAGVRTSENQLMKFLMTYVGASDIPDLHPPNAVFPTVSSPLTKENTFLLLNWIRSLKTRGIQLQGRFLKCIKEGSWLKISLGCSSGYRPPSQSFFPTTSWANILQCGSVLVDIPLVDQGFYGNEINDYKEELKTVGVMFEYGEACRFIGDHLMSLAASSKLTRANVLSILNFIKILRENYMPPENFIRSIKEGQWLRTRQGYRSPVGLILYDSEWKAATQISDLPFINQDYYGEEILNFRKEFQLLGVIVGFNQYYQLVIDNFRFPASWNSLTVDAFFLILECIRHSISSQNLVGLLKDKKWLRTNMGYRSPCECFLFKSEWGCLLQVFSDYPLIDHNFYGARIYSYENELKAVGVVVDFEQVAKAFARYFKWKISSSSLRKENILSFLACYKHLKKGDYKFPSELNKCIREEKWIKTRLGNRSPAESILFCSDWDCILPVALLPFIDDSDNGYGKGIKEFKDELKVLGVVTEFKEGAKFIIDGITIPRNPSHMTPTNVISLLKCIQNMQQEMGHDSLPKSFLKRISGRWLKTYMGYKPPNNCLLFDSKWSMFLQREDGPFIDDGFYGSSISSYKKELHAIGVTVNVADGCELLASYLESHSQFSAISRIYEYLSKFNWELENKASTRIWIPNGTAGGEWVRPEECVLHDGDSLFGLKLNVLEKHYDTKLLGFFSKVLKVRWRPSIDDYCNLWKDWENSGCPLKYDECCAFWLYVLHNCSSNSKFEILSNSMSKLPVDTGSGEILLVGKQDVFIPDDLQLKDLFEKASMHPLFIWYPQRGLHFMCRGKLFEIYSSIGVQTISEAVKKDQSSKLECVEPNQVRLNEKLIGKELCRLILGFLGDPSLELNVERRHQILKYLLDVTVFETGEPISVSYTLPLSSGNNVTVRASRMIRWERENLKLFTQKMDKSSGHKTKIEFATNFSEVISEGLLWDKEDRIAGLCELIKLGCLLEFEEDATNFLMKSRNLQVSMEDEEFLSSVFTSDRLS
ncbi:PREDICTED: uncharacterized protein LOC104592797 [Nelumbo nucifera]|uniref:Sacsin/Nov domain-containing protein n=2 Tax=Nelumbo nucifera TaxID=4432 RepID=A0A822YRY0_NELNU|nr:PREDICTED: uncharacterized protein LOC104592797 [Nelumbo nucifera]DAD34149.1 TPA_asm: hypothetical protein HUJ06_004789 [Nelumbo nucifera]